MTRSLGLRRPPAPIRAPKALSSAFRQGVPGQWPASRGRPISCQSAWRQRGAPGDQVAGSR
ncbi:hypothetical protein [Synechococcus sp. GFB01]|uniref:hypothetical protein n=1 Tax=Synechococcus sp. GFB01 TaxID=1662190 RepID=UPI0009082A9E|nr:hypothetical protein [Synechococcus sp. GFB01]